MAPKEEPKLSYKVLTGFCIGNAVNVWPGEVLELTESEARRWVGVGYIEKTDGKPSAAPAVRNQDPRGLKTQDPK